MLVDEIMKFWRSGWRSNLHLEKFKNCLKLMGFAFVIMELSKEHHHKVFHIKISEGCADVG